MIVGHTHRIANLMRGRILITEGLNAGASYSVLQLMVRDGDVAWAGGATRVAKNIGVAPRADVKAIVDAANAATAVLRNQVIGTQQFDIRRAPSRLFESAMGNMVADAMRAKYRASRRRTQTRAASGRTCCACRPAQAKRPARSPGARCSQSCRSATGR
jgi:2',3'-cyclic-nucleotide 2'-phosphodiesterase (5'-nucleotidase family)